MTAPMQVARLLRDVVAAGTRHQLTLAEQTKDDGLLVRCANAQGLPDGVASPYVERPDVSGAFLTVDPAGRKPAPPTPDEDGTVAGEEQRAYEERVANWRQHRQLYNDLFAARTPSEQYELVVAVGLLEHHGDERHHRHVVAAPAEITLDQDNQRLTVVVSDAFRVEHNWLAGSLRSPLVEALDDRRHDPLLEVLADEAETYSGVADTWRRARSVYGQDTLWEPGHPPPLGVVALSVEPAVLLRKKDTSHLLALLTDMAEDLETGGHVTGPLQMLTDMSATVPDLQVANDQAALPKPANDEQRSMLEQARRSPHTIIQGPPGTGKTHTIANLAAVLMAEGRRVLITAENDRALREVQGKLPTSMRPLLLPRLKDKKESGLARSVTSLIEEADKARRGARPDQEAALSRKRDDLTAEIDKTVRQIRHVDALEAQEHELHGQRMRLAGHMIAIDGYRKELELADRYVSPRTAPPDDARALLELHDQVTKADRDLTELSLTTGIPEPESFAQQLQETRESLGQLPDRNHFDYATLDAQVVSRLNDMLPRLGSLPSVPYAKLDLSTGEYRALAQQARDARAGLNHGVTATGTDPATALEYLAAYVDLPTHYTAEPQGLMELFRRATEEADGNPSVHVASSTNPVEAFEAATDIASAFASDPAQGMLARYVTDLRQRGDSNLEHLAGHASELADQTGVPPTLPIDIGDDAPASHELLEQATKLRNHLADGGKMTRIIGTPRVVRDAAELIAHVTVSGSKVDTFQEAEAVIAHLKHRLAVATARNWAANHDLTPPDADPMLKDWLTALARLPEQAKSLETKLAALLDQCHTPAETQALPADQLAQEVRTSAAVRIVNELDRFADRRQRLGPADVRVDGVIVHERANAETARAHFRSLVDRAAVAGELPHEWTAGQDLHQPTGDDPLALACEVAAAAADVPGQARPQTLNDTSIRDVLSRVAADGRRQELTDGHSAFLGGIRAALSMCVPPSPATKMLTDAVNAEDAAGYRRAHAAHVDEVARAERARRLQEATESVRAVHPSLVAAFLSGDEETHDVLADLGRYQQLLAYRSEAEALLADYPDLRRLHDQLRELRREQLEVEAELASERCWSRAVERLAADRELGAALSSLQKAERAVPKTKTAKTYQRKLRAMRQATRRAAPAIPCWVMPIDKVAELVGYPRTKAERFDVVIVDEASQAWFPAAFLYAIAEQVIVVGDDLQTSPSDTSVRNDDMVRLVAQHIPDHKLRDDLDGQFSLYDIAAAISAPSVMVDHFRCVPPIIELSNALCYAERGQRLLPVRVTAPDALEPIRHVRVLGERSSAAGSNTPEIDAIVDRVAQCVADPAYDRLTFGVVVVGSRPHAHTKKLRRRLLDALGPQQMQQRQIEVGSPAQYQGSERNIMFLSLVVTPDDNGNVRLWPHELTGRNLRRVQSLNVAVSRAQDQLWIFHSFGPENLKPGDIRHVLLTPPAARDEATLDAQLARCDSQFERDVVTALAAHPAVARIRTQVEALGRKLDVVVESYDNRRLAVECDGDAWHTSDADVAKDLYRQRTLETAGGWKFQRFLASEWYADQQTIIDETIEMLGTAPKPKVPPATDDVDADQDVDDSDDEDGGAPDAAATDAPDSDRSPVTDAENRELSDDVPERDEPDPQPQADHSDDERERPTDANDSPETPQADEPKTPASGAPTASASTSVESLGTYPSWNTDDWTGDLDDMSPGEKRELILRVVEREGPILGDRLYTLVAQSSGKSRVGGRIRKSLNLSTFALESQSELVTDNPLDEAGQKVKTFRLPDQPEILVRELGPRTLHEVPPAELAAVMGSVRRPGQTEEEWFRAVLDSYGLVRLTSATSQRLRACAALL